MPIISVIIVLILVGVVLWAVNAFIPMEARIKSIMNIVVIVAVLLWLLSLFGVFSSLSSIRIGR